VGEEEDHLLFSRDRVKLIVVPHQWVFTGSETLSPESLTRELHQVGGAEFMLPSSLHLFPVIPYR